MNSCNIIQLHNLGHPHVVYSKLQGSKYKSYMLFASEVLCLSQAHNPNTILKHTFPL